MPMIAAILVSFLIIEAVLLHSDGDVEWRPLFYGAIAFVCAWLLHLAFAGRIKRAFQMEDLSIDAFGPGASPSLLSALWPPLQPATLGAQAATQSVP